jgi:hypothetical protein
VYGHVNQFMRVQPGYVRKTLHRARSVDARHRFVDEATP